MAGRKYERSHPWITFSADFRRASPQFWLLLGEAAALSERIAQAPVRPAVSEEMHRVYLVKGVLATTAIEGNTLSENEVRAQLEGELSLPPSKAYLQQEVENIIRACERSFQQIVEDQVPELSTDLVKQFNRDVLEGLEELGDGVVPGQVSEHNVKVGGVYLGAPREDCEFLLDRLSTWLREIGTELWPEWRHPTRLAMAIVKAVLAHLYTAWIHPFGDGNGRTARLIEFQLLASAGMPSPACHLLSNHYNETRAEYYRQLDRASKSGGDIFPFLQYAVQGLVDGLRTQLDIVQTEHLHLAWESFVAETFQAARSTKTSERQRDLVMDLSFESEPVSRHKISDLTTRLARHYATKGPKTITRDLNKLEGMGLIRHEFGGYVANTRTMLGFVPVMGTMDSATETETS